MEAVIGDTCMAEEERTELEKQRAAYRATAEALEVVRVKELAAMTDAEALRMMKSLVAVDPFPAQPANWSGLVEQQAIFQRGRSA
jgi:hypothetical protein